MIEKSREKTSRESFAVLGAGAIGCFIGAHLAAASARVVFIGRSRLGSIAKSSGLMVQRFDADPIFLPANTVSWTESLEAIRDVDTVLITVKSQDTETCAREIAPLLKPNAKIVSFQNGVRNIKMLQSHISHHKIVGGMVPFNVVQSENQAAFSQATSGRLYIDGQTRDVLPGLYARLNRAGLPLQPTKHLQELQWGKLVKNLTNSLNALVGLPLSKQLEDREHRLILAASLGEALRIARKSGIKIANDTSIPLELFPMILRMPDFLFHKLAASQIKITPDARLSMWWDLKLGRRTEVDYLNGEIVDLASQRGLTAPIHEKILNLVKQAEKTGRGSPGYAARELMTLLEIS